MAKEYERRVGHQPTFRSLEDLFSEYRETGTAPLTGEKGGPG